MGTAVTTAVATVIRGPDYQTGVPLLRRRGSCGDSLAHLAQCLHLLEHRSDEGKMVLFKLQGRLIQKYCMLAVLLQDVDTAVVAVHQVQRPSCTQTLTQVAQSLQQGCLSVKQYIYLIRSYILTGTSYRYYLLELIYCTPSYFTI